MTDITELVQRDKFEAWVMTQICISKSTMEGLRTADGYRNTTLSGTNYNRMWNCWKAAGAELVEALEKAQAKADVYDMLRDDYGLREKGVGLADFVDWQAKRITELESRTVTVKLPKAMSIEGGAYCSAHAHYDPDGDYYDRADVEEMLAAAGIKVEAE